MKQGLNMMMVRALTGMAGLALVAGVMLAGQAQAAGRVAPVVMPAMGLEEATSLRRLDIMLMVTGLRCRATPDDFLSDFVAFEGAHLAELNMAAAVLRGQLGAEGGRAAADRALDRMGVVMANQYGGGHPWMGCGALKAMTRELVETRDRAAMLVAAERALGKGRQVVNAQ